MASKQSKLLLGKNLKFEDAKKLHKRLCTCADKQVNVIINAEKVASLDMSALQLLVAFVQKVRINGNIVKWHKPSNVFLDTIVMAGLAKQLDLVVSK